MAKMITSMNVLDVIEKVAKIISIIAIPVVIAVLGNYVNSSINSRTLNKDYVGIAVNILSSEKKEADESLRKWAVDLLNATAPVPIDMKSAKDLESGKIIIPMSSKSSLSELRDKYAETGRLDKALQFQMEALYKIRKEKGGNHPDLIEPLKSISRIYKSMGQYDKAEDYLMQALYLERKNNE